MRGKDAPRQQPVAAIEAAVVSLRRAQKRRSLAGLSARRGRGDGPHAALPDAVFELLDAAQSAQDDGRPLAVTDAAALLGVDQPRASRLAAQALAAGLLRREADQGDGRRSLLVLTTEGREVLSAISEFRQSVIAEATADWTAADRADLARLLTRFVDSVAQVTSQGRPD